MRQTAKRDKHSEIVGRRARKSATYRKTFGRTLHQIDLALLVREMREAAGLTQTELAKRVGTTQSAIARLEDAEYAGQSLAMLERIAAPAELASSSMRRKNPISTVRSHWSSVTESRPSKDRKVSSAIKAMRSVENNFLPSMKSGLFDLPEYST